MRWTGRRLRRFEDPALVRGLGRFVADVADRHPGALHAAFVRSSVPAGVIRSIEAPPDATVLTGASFPGIGTICARLDRPDFVALETPVLAADAVRHPGEPVALAVAGSRAEAEDLGRAGVRGHRPGRAGARHDLGHRPGVAHCPCRP